MKYVKYLLPLINRREVISVCVGAILPSAFDKTNEVFNKTKLIRIDGVALVISNKILTY